MLNGHDLRLCAVHAGCSDKTVRRFFQGKPIHTTTRVRLEQALRELNLPLPTSSPSPELTSPAPSPTSSSTAA